MPIDPRHVASQKVKVTRETEEVLRNMRSRGAAVPKERFMPRTHSAASEGGRAGAGVADFLSPANANWTQLGSGATFLLPH